MSYPILSLPQSIFTYNQRSIPKKVSTLSQLVADATQNLISVIPDMTTLKYVEPPPMGSAEEEKLVTTTVHSYDLQQLRGLWKSQLMGVGMMAVMHLYFKYTNPLLIQSIIPLKGAFEGNLVKIHLYGLPAIGDLKRPWKAAGGMMGMGGGEPKSDRKSIEQAERSRNGGVKDE